MKHLSLGEYFKITDHACKRYYERFFGCKEMFAEDILLARVILKNLLNNRALKIIKEDNEIVKVTVFNAIFVYHKLRREFLTVYPSDNLSEQLPFLFKIPLQSGFSKSFVKDVNFLKLGKRFTPIRLQFRFATDGIVPVGLNSQVLIGIWGKFTVVYHIKQEKLIGLSRCNPSGEYIRLSANARNKTKVYNGILYHDVLKQAKDDITWNKWERRVLSKISEASCMNSGGVISHPTRTGRVFGFRGSIIKFYICPTGPGTVLIGRI